jgi:hypothetical protein
LRTYLYPTKRCGPICKASRTYCRRLISPALQVRLPGLHHRTYVVRDLRLRGNRAHTVRPDISNWAGPRLDALGRREPRASTPLGGAVDYSLPPPEPTYSIDDVLRLVGAIRRVAYDRSLAPDDQMRRIRDLFLSYDHPEVDE